MSAENKPFGRKALALMRRGPFQRYILGSLVSDTGTWMQIMAQGYVMSTLTDKNLYVGLVNFAAGIPTLALTMIGGSAADRFDKRKILVVTQVGQIILASILGWLVLTNRIQIWHVASLATLLGILFAFEVPAASALVPELVKRDEIAAAVAMDRAVFHGSRFIGTSVGGLIVAAWGAASAFFINAFSFVALIVAIISLPPRKAGTKEEEEERRGGIMDGFRYVKSDRIMVSMIALVALTALFVFPVLSVMLPLYVKNVLRLGPRELGWLMGISASGAFSGALGLLSIAPENRFRFMTGNAIAVAMGLFCMSRTTNFTLTAISMGFLAIGLSMNFGLANTIVQERAPAPLRGRVSAVFAMSFFGIMPIAGLGIPGLADVIGTRTTLGLAAISFGIGSFLVLRAAGRTVCEAPTEPVGETAVAATL